MNAVLIDTNIFIRFITGDVAALHKKAESFFTEVEKGTKKGLVSILVINEIVWVLKKYYSLKPDQYIPGLINLLLLPNIDIIEAKKASLITILEKMRQTKIDFTDLYLAEIAGSRDIVSFDTDFAKLKN